MKTFFDKILITTIADIILFKPTQSKTLSAQFVHLYSHLCYNLDLPTISIVVLAIPLDYLINANNFDIT